MALEQLLTDVYHGYEEFKDRTQDDGTSWAGGAGSGCIAQAKMTAKGVKGLGFLVSQTSSGHWD